MEFVYFDMMIISIILINVVSEINEML